MPIARKHILPPHRGDQIGSSSNYRVYANRLRGDDTRTRYSNRAGSIKWDASNRGSLMLPISSSPIRALFAPCWILVGFGQPRYSDGLLSCDAGGSVRSGVDGGASGGAGCGATDGATDGAALTPAGID